MPETHGLTRKEIGKIYSESSSRMSIETSKCSNIINYTGVNIALGIEWKSSSLYINSRLNPPKTGQWPTDNRPFYCVNMHINSRPNRPIIDHFRTLASLTGYQPVIGRFGQFLAGFASYWCTYLMRKIVGYLIGRVDPTFIQKPNLDPWESTCILTHLPLYMQFTYM